MKVNSKFFNELTKNSKKLIKNLYFYLTWFVLGDLESELVDSVKKMG